MLELAEIWKLGLSVVFLSICTVRFPKTTLALGSWELSHLTFGTNTFVESFIE
jgi:hypothetical protein